MKYHPINILRKIRNSWSFRSAIIYKAIFSKLPILADEGMLVDARITYVTLSGINQLPMLRASLWSLRRTSNGLPRLVIACDTKLGKTEVARTLKWWRGPIEVWSASELMAFADSNLPDYLAVLCKRHVYGLKLAAIMKASKTGWTIYADTDVIWFQDFTKLLRDSGEDTDIYLRLQKDRQMSYDLRLLDVWPELRQKPYSCAGVICAKGELQKLLLHTVAEKLKMVGEMPMVFTEQTIMAALQRAAGQPCFKEEDAYLGWDDQYRRGPSFKNMSWILRHYVGPVRHLFWRDALWMYVWRSGGSASVHGLI